MLGFGVLTKISIKSNVRVREIHKTINSLCRSPVAIVWKFMEQIYPQ